MLNLTIGEFFSLTVETFRHQNQLSSDPLREASFLRHVQCVIEKHPLLLSLVKVYGCPFLFKQLVSVVLKAEEVASPVQSVQFIVPILSELLQLSLCTNILDCWVRKCSIDLLPVYLLKYLTYFSSTESSQSCATENAFFDQYGLVCISIRKLVLLCLKCTASLFQALSLHSPNHGKQNVLWYV